jgi:hypothetical protein
MSEAIRTEIFPSTAVTAAGATAGFSIPTANNLVLLIDVTSHTVPTTLYLEVSDDGGTTWFGYPCDTTMIGTGAPAAAPAAGLTTTGIAKHLMLARNIPADRFRLRWLTGTLTFSAVAIAK